MDELHAIIAQVTEAAPAFAQPWEADAFVIAVALSQRGYFSWPQWVEQFAQEIHHSPQRRDESAHTAYYRQWLSCLEKILSQHHLIPQSELLSREEQWRQAFLNTLTAARWISPPPAVRPTIYMTMIIITTIMITTQCRHQSSRCGSSPPLDNHLGSIYESAE